ncbi:MAG: type II secretion system protein [Bacilli bacterium]|nr:type II secretion system protein [Bacilli bacterium]
MKKNGFTLVELLGVVIVVVALSLIVFPLIMNNFKKNRKEISELTKKMLEDATIVYMEENPNTYEKINGNIYCISLSQVVNSGNLSSPLNDPTTGNEILLSNKVKVTVENRQYVPNYIADSNCVESRS